MKRLFFILLFINLAVLGLILLDRNTPSNNLQAREINASAIKTVTGQLAKLAKAPEASGVAASSPASAPATAASSIASAPQAACLRLTGISPELAAQARSKLKTLKLDAKESGGSDSRVWVYIPPLESQEVARKKTQQLAELGIEDFFVINNGSKWQNAISLGVYSSREAGEKHLAALKAKGVKSAQLRDKDDTPKPLTFSFKALSPENREQLQKISAQLKGAALQETTCP